jgi:hypothetical protein
VPDLLRLLLVLCVACGAAPAAANSVRAGYTTSLLGFTVARANLQLRLIENNYTMQLGVEAAGLALIFSSFKGTAQVEGRLGAERAYPARFKVDATAGSDVYDIALAFSGTDVANQAVSPPHDPHPDLVPMDTRSRRAVVDPLSAFLAPTPSGTPQTVCNRRLPIYTGRERFDLQLSFARNETVRIDGGRPLQAIVCKARYFPIQGHRTDRDEVQYMSRNEDVFAWFVPIEGAPLMALYRVRVGTRIGAVIVQLDSLEGDNIQTVRRQR